MGETEVQVANAAAPVDDAVKPAETTTFAKAPEQVVTPAPEVKPAVAPSEPDDRYKGIQRVVAQKDMEIARLQKELEAAKSGGLPAEELQTIRLEIAELRDENVSLKAAYEESQGKEPVKPAQSYAEQVRHQSAAVIQNTKAQSIASMLTQTGYAANDPLFKDAADMWSLGEKSKDPKFFHMAENNIRTLLSVLPPRAGASPAPAAPVQQANPVQDMEKLVNQRVEERLKAMKIDPALLKVETGQASQLGIGSMNAQQLRDAFIANPTDPQIRERYMAMRSTRL